MRRSAAAALVAGLLLAVAPGAGGAEHHVRIPEGIDRLLADKGRAFETEDRELLASTLAPGRFAEERLEALDHSKGVPIDRYGLRVTTRFAGSILSSRVEAAYPDHEVAAHHVIEETSLGGVERAPFVEDSFYTFVRSGAPDDRYGGWRIASNADFEVLGAFSARHLWDEGPVAVERTEHFLLLSHPELVAELRGVLGVAEQAYAEVRAWWPRPVDERYVVFAPRASAELGRMINATIDLSKFVAFAGATVHFEEGWEPAGVRLYLHMDRFRRYDADGQRVILAHELIHAVTRPASGPFIPFWVEEGLAMVGSEPEDGLRQARRGPAPDAFPTDDEFFVGAVEDIVRTYRRSQVAAGVLTDRLGVEGLARFYEVLGSARIAPGTADHHLARAVEAVGWNHADWEQAWLERVR